MHEYPTRAASQVFPVSAYHGSQIRLPAEVNSMPLDSFSESYGVSLWVSPPMYRQTLASAAA